MTIMAFNLILVAGPLVGASSWAAAAEKLRNLGVDVQVPDVLMAAGEIPPWHAWPSHVTSQIRVDKRSVFVGHSSASTVVVDLAARLPCRGLVIVDGEVPPAHGPVFPVRESLREFIRTLDDGSGTLPSWPNWWKGNPRAALIGVDTLAAIPAEWTIFERDAPRMRVDWFDDTIELARWDGVPAAFIQTSPIYQLSADEADRRGWPVVRLGGTHLHPTLEPDETAAAILRICGQLRWP